MSTNELKGGRADKMSVEDIAKKHGVSVEAIQKELEIGKGVESEHADSKEVQREIAIDHLVEDPKYYSDPVTGLIAKEKMAEKELNVESKKFMALAGIKEGDKKFLVNEAFSDNEPPLERDQANPENWKGMDSMMADLNGVNDPFSKNLIKVQDKVTGDYKSIAESGDEQEPNPDSDSDFTITEFDQTEVRPGDDDEKLYKLG